MATVIQATIDNAKPEQQLSESILNRWTKTSPPTNHGDQQQTELPWKYVGQKTHPTLNTQQSTVMTCGWVWRIILWRSLCLGYEKFTFFQFLEKLKAALKEPIQILMKHNANTTQTDENQCMLVLFNLKQRFITQHLRDRVAFQPN